MADGDLAVNTVVTTPDGSPSAFLALGPGDAVPGWALEQLGEHCFEGGVKPKAKPSRAKVSADGDGGSE